MTKAKIPLKTTSTSWAGNLMEIIVVILVGGSFLGAGTRWHNPVFILMSIVISWTLIHFFLKARHSNWQEFGFRRPKSWPQTLGWALQGQASNLRFHI